MSKLQNLLQANSANATRAELIELINSVRDLIGESQFSDVVGLSPSEIAQLKKQDLQQVVVSLADNYEVAWEKGFKANLSNWKSLIQAFNVSSTDFFVKSDATNSGFAAELGSIDFATIIGGPLDACVKAQSNASLSTIQFINEIGFEGTGNNAKLRMAEFSYKRSKPDPNDPTKTIEENKEIKVPFVSMVNIPSFRIESCEIDFNVNLKSTYTKDIKDELGVKAGLSASYFTVKFNVEVSYKRTSSTGIKVEKEYSLGVKVKATNDEMPAGLSKLLGLLAE